MKMLAAALGLATVALLLAAFYSRPATAALGYYMGASATWLLAVTLWNER